MSTSHVSRATLAVSICVLGALAGARAMHAREKRPIAPEDYFSLREVAGLQLSPSGNEALYMLREADLAAKRVRQSLWRFRLDRPQDPVRLTIDERDGAPQWAPDGARIAFLSSREKSTQVWLLPSGAGDPRRLTGAGAGVLAFKWSPDGRRIAFLAPAAAESPATAQRGQAERGIVLDKMNVNVYQFMGNRLFIEQGRQACLWTVDVETGRAEQLTRDPHIVSFEWSPDGRSLAVAQKEAPDAVSPSDIAVYAVAGKTSTVLLRGTTADGWYVTGEYSSPFWSPDGTRIAATFTSADERKPPRVGIYSLETRQFTPLTSEDALELYGARFQWLHDDTIYVENTHRAGRRLFALSARDGTVQMVVGGDAYDSQFSFSADRGKVLFVRETLQSPPEIHVATSPFREAIKLSALNRHYEDVRLPPTERVRWTAPDGVPVEGWIFKPSDFDEGRRYPTLVFVHGGPVHVMANRFEPYWNIWPYPFRALAEEGYVVFAPNYRGTGSYGNSFRRTKHALDDAAADVVSGIDALVQRGIADPDRLGIFGQSHGAWLGPHIMGRHRRFTVASFAEGPSEFLSAYSYVPGWHNLSSHEASRGESPYRNPQPYLDISPVFKFQGLDTATLLEYGDQSLVVAGLGVLSALWREGTPHEMVVYPGTGHNVSSLPLQTDSIARNLDWFDYWMPAKGRRAPRDISAARRWEAMRRQMQKMRQRNANAR